MKQYSQIEELEIWDTYVLKRGYRVVAYEYFAANVIHNSFDEITEKDHL